MSFINELKQQFITPPEEFSPVPFWFWNDQLDKLEIKRQIADFKDKGVMSFVIHPRIGIPIHIQFLSEEFLNYMEIAILEAKRQGMTVYLYDEAMYPSGSAHGMVVEGNPEYASRGLKVNTYNLADLNCNTETIEKILSCNLGETLVSIQLVKLISDSELDFNKTVILDPQKLYDIIADIIAANKSKEFTILVFLEAFTGGVIRGIHYGEEDFEAGAPAYPDVLNPNACSKFISIVYETFYRRFGQYFGNTIKGIFTDEPRPLAKRSPKHFKPWTGNFLAYLKTNGFNEEDLPCLWCKGKDNTQRIRREFEKIVNKRLSECYYGPISEWCQSHQVAFCGHPIKGDDIGFQKYFTIPGQDLVLRWVEPRNINALEGSESTLAKCTSDAARHWGKRRNSNECFGAFGWKFNVDEMKWIMDWLFVRGVNMLFPHAFYYSIREERYNERPPDMGPNNSWWTHYSLISDYIKRMCWLMTDSYNLTEIAVLCESHYMSWRIAKPLYCSQVEFNYLQREVFLSEKCIINNEEIRIEKQLYKVLIIEDTISLDTEMFVKLKKFMNNGGKVVLYRTGFEGECLNGGGITEVNNDQELLTIINEISNKKVGFSSQSPDLRVSCVKKENIMLYLLVNEGETNIYTDVCFKQCSKVEIWDAWRGNINEIVPSSYYFLGEQWCKIPILLERRESIIVAAFKDCGQLRGCASIRNSGQDDDIFEYISFNNRWTISGLPVEVKMEDVFKDWTNIKRLRNFSGTGVYKNEFSINAEGVFSKYFLDCGEAYDFITIYLNGCKVGTKFWKPFIFDISAFIEQGINMLEIHVTNSMSNRYTDEKINSGLVGPVTIKGYESIYTFM